MDDITIARAIHVLAVLLWIGSVAFVTLVVMPSIRAAHPPTDRLAAFHKLEGRFAAQAQMWDRFADPQFWGMHAMVGLWSIAAGSS